MVLRNTGLGVRWMISLGVRVQERRLTYSRHVFILDIVRLPMAYTGHCYYSICAFSPWLLKTIVTIFGSIVFNRHHVARYSIKNIDVNLLSPISYL